MMDLHILLDPVTYFLCVTFSTMGWGLIRSTKILFKTLKIGMVVKWGKYFMCVDEIGFCFGISKNQCMN